LTNQKRHEYLKNPEDMVALNYDDKPTWEVITTALIEPSSDEAKLFGQELESYK